MSVSQDVDCAICGFGAGLDPNQMIWQDNHWMAAGLMDGPGLEGDYLAHEHIPVDNERHLMWGIVFDRFRPLSRDHIGMKFINSIPRRWEYRDDISRDNMWGQNRARMMSGESFMGLDVDAPYDILWKDFATIESMGPIYDRTTEHLAPADLVIACGRTRLLNLVTVADKGKPTNCEGAFKNVLPTFAWAEYI